MTKVSRDKLRGDAWRSCLVSEGDHWVILDSECWRRTRRGRGLGDTIANVTTALGIQPCAGCKKRQAALNALVPYRG